MIEAAFHPLDEVKRFGFASHGLVAGTGSSSPLLRVGAAEFALPFAWPFSSDASERYDTHLLRVPGIAPPTLSAEEVATEAAAGRTWQHYAVLAEDRLVLFGTALEGWVCIDPAGKRWLVKATPHINLGRAYADQPLELVLSVVPFGYLDEATATPITQTITLADIGQAGPYQEPPSASSNPNELMMRIGSISSTGRKVVIELHGASVDRKYTAPAGFLLLELAGTGPTFSAALSVLRTRGQVLGSYTENRVWPQMIKIDLAWDSVSTPRTVGGHPGADVIATPSAVSFSGVVGHSGARPFYGSGYVGDSRTGRIAGLVFDDADQLVEFSYDVIYRTNYNFPAFNVDSMSGDVRGWIDDTSSIETTSITSTVSVSVSRVSTETVTGSIRLKRNGTEVGRGVLSTSRTISESCTHTPPVGLERVDGVVGGRALEQNWLAGSYTQNTSATIDEGVGAVSSADPPFSGDVYSAGLFELMLASAAVEPYAYGAVVGDGRLRLQRLSNALFSVLVTVGGGTEPLSFRTPCIVGPQAVWSNPAATDGSFGRVASYHPFTHEIFSDTTGGPIAKPFVWI